MRTGVDGLEETDVSGRDGIASSETGTIELHTGIDGFRVGLGGLSEHDITEGRRWSAGIGEQGLSRPSGIEVEAEDSGARDGNEYLGSRSSAGR